MDFPAPPKGLAGGSELLSRVQAFLPQMEKANKELEEKIEKEGADSVRIDKTLDPSDPAVPQKKSKKSLIREVGATDEVSEDDEEGDEEEVGTREGGADRHVQLEFALGDFDDTPIAQAERAAAELKEKQTGSSSSDGAAVASSSTTAPEIIFKMPSAQDE